MNKQSLHANLIEKSSVFYGTKAIFTDSGNVCVSHCREVMEYLKNQSITPRRLGHFIACMKCPCKDSIKSDLQKSHPNYMTEYLKLVIESRISISQPLNLKRYNDSGIVGIISCHGNYEPELANNPQFIKDMISVDHIRNIPYDYNTISLMIDRVEYLSKENDVIYQGVISHYAKYFNNLYKVSYMSNIPESLFKRAMTALPIIDRGKKPTTAFRMLRMLIYYLYKEIDIDDDMMNSIMDDVRQNPNKYVDILADENKSSLNKFVESCKRSLNIGVKVMNDIDLSGDMIEEYHPKHIIRYCDKSGEIYQFTSPSFKRLSKEKINPYNNEMLPKFVLDYMSHYRPLKMTMKPMYLLINNLLNPKDVCDLISPILEKEEKKINREMANRFKDTIRSLRSQIINTRETPTRENPTVIEPDNECTNLLIYDRNHIDGFQTIRFNIVLWYPGYNEPEDPGKNIDELRQYLMTTRRKISSGDIPTYEELTLYVKYISRLNYLLRDRFVSIYY